MATITIATGKHRDIQVETRWRGKSLAVHRKATSDPIAATRGWTITHHPTGHAVCHSDRNLKDTIAFARMWDKRFLDISQPSDVKGWRWRDTFLRDKSAFMVGNQPDGPILPDDPTPQDVATAITGIPPIEEDDANAPFKEWPGMQVRAAVDGWPEVFWAGPGTLGGNHWHRVPTVGDMESWIVDSVCETPAGETVEPDHPASWLSLAGLV